MLICRFGPDGACCVGGILMAVGGENWSHTGIWQMDNGEKGSSLHLIQTAKSPSVKLAQILNRYKITRLILRYFHNNFNIHEAYSTIGLVHKP